MKLKKSFIKDLLLTTLHLDDETRQARIPHTSLPARTMEHTLIFRQRDLTKTVSNTGDIW